MFADAVKNNAVDLVLLTGRGHPGKVSFYRVQGNMHLDIVDTPFHHNIGRSSGKGNVSPVVAGVGCVADGIAQKSFSDLDGGLTAPAAVVPLESGELREVVRDLAESIRKGEISDFEAGISPGVTGDDGITDADAAVGIEAGVFVHEIVQ